MSWNELKNDFKVGVGGVYSFIKWTLIACAIGGIIWALKSCTWEKYWDSGFY